MALALGPATGGLTYWSAVEHVHDVDGRARAVWHAVAVRDGVLAMTALCRWPHTPDAVDAGRPWHKTVWAYRCPTCERLSASS